MSKDSFKKASGSNNLGSAWLVLLVSLLVFFASQILASLVVGLVSAALNGGNVRKVSVTDQFFYVLLAEGLAAAFVIYIVRRGPGLKFIGLGRKPKGKDVLTGLGGFLVFFVSLIVINGILSYFFPDINKGTQDVGFNNLQGTAQNLLAFLALVLVPPAGEEILVRGYLFSGLRARMRFFSAMLITSFLFGVAHLQTGGDVRFLWAAAVNTFVLSIVLVYLRERTGALYASMLLHALNNAVAFGFRL